MIPSHLPTKGNTLVFVSVAEELERVPQRSGQVYGESPAWIRRVLQAYSATEEQRWRALLRQAARGSRADVPLGAPISLTDIEQPTITSIPSLASRPVRVTTGQVPVVPVSSGRQPTAPNQAVVPTQPIKKETTMDLGSIITNLGGQYIQARYGQPAPAAPSLRPVMQVPVGMGVDTYGITPTPAFLPALPGAVAGAGSLAGKIGGAVAGLGLGLAADEIAMIAGVASKVKCRRRRRRLATHSDIKDLAALKAVLGSGKAFDTWIATRRV